MGWMRKGDVRFEVLVGWALSCAWQGSDSRLEIRERRGRSGGLSRCVFTDGGVAVVGNGGGDDGCGI